MVAVIKQLHDLVADGDLAVVIQLHLKLIYYMQALSNKLIGLVGRVFTNGPWDRGSIPGRVVTKTFKNDTWYLLA